MDAELLYPILVNLGLAALLLCAIPIRGLHGVSEVFYVSGALIFGFINTDRLLSQKKRHQKYGAPWHGHFTAQPLTLLTILIVVAAVVIGRERAGAWTVLSLGFLAGSRSAFVYDGLGRSRS
jgi:hypothetical protein